MSCLTRHDYVVASGTCAACGLPVQLTGAVAAGDTQVEGLVWLAPPFADLDAAATCRATGDLHTVEHARGACACCSASLTATSPGGGEL